MRRLISAAVFLTVFAFVPMAAQNDSGHVFVTHYYKELAGQEELYNRYVFEYGLPYFDELVGRDDVVSFKVAFGWSGTNEWTHVLIQEFENWDAVDTPVDALGSALRRWLRLRPASIPFGHGRSSIGVRLR